MTLYLGRRRRLRVMASNVDDETAAMMAALSLSQTEVAEDDDTRSPAGQGLMRVVDELAKSSPAAATRC